MQLDLAGLAAEYDLEIDDVIRACTDDPVLADYVNTAADFFYTFKPRPDDPANFDEQSAFVNASDVISFMIAGNGCLAADEQLYDPVDGSTIAIADRRQAFYVWSRSPDGHRTLGIATPSYTKGTAALYRVGLSNGQSFICTLWHRVLTPTGFVPLGALPVCSQLLSLPRPRFDACRPRSIGEFCHLGFPPNAGRSFRTRQDCPGHCSMDYHLCGAQPRYLSNSARGPFLQLAGARERTRQNWLADDRDSEQGCSPLCQKCDRLSTIHCEHLARLSRAAQRRPSSYTLNSRFSDLVDTRDQDAFSNTAATRQTTEDRQSLEAFFHPSHTTREFDRRATEQQTLPLEASIACNITSIDYVGQSDFYDISVWPWNNYELAGVIHHNSGKTEAAAYKCARFLLNKQPPPRKDTPFWILNKTKELAADVCWKEKLVGNGHLPANEIEWSRISWEDKKAGRPSDVPLKPWPKDKGGHPDKNWVLEFKSYDQGRQALQSKSIGGFWFSEQFPVDLLTETMVRCRDYLHPGGQFCEFTPIEPDLCIWIERLMEETPDGWRFYRGNTEANRGNLATGAIEAFIATVPDELIETRLRGALASFEGAIYPTFSLAVHVVDDEILTRIPSGCWHAMGTDWGSSKEHPHTTLLGCIDGMGDWWIYDEYWCNEQSKTTYDHAQAVVERCAAWGWPTTYGSIHGGRQRILKLNSSADPHFGVNFADPSRPGEINNFSIYGIPTMPASNRVYDGINLVRSLLKPDIKTGRPRLHIARRCRHLIDEMRKYRWRRSRKPTEGDYLNATAAAPVPLKRDDDTVDSCRYLIASFDRGRGGGDPERTRETPIRKGVQLADRGSSPAASRGLAGVFKPGNR